MINLLNKFPFSGSFFSKDKEIKHKIKLVLNLNKIINLFKKRPTKK